MLKIVETPFGLMLIIVFATYFGAHGPLPWWPTALLFILGYAFVKLIMDVTTKRNKKESNNA